MFFVALVRAPLCAQLASATWSKIVWLSCQLSMPVESEITWLCNDFAACKRLVQRCGVQLQEQLSKVHEGDRIVAVNGRLAEGLWLPMLGSRGAALPGWLCRFCIQAPRLGPGKPGDSKELFNLIADNGNKDGLEVSLRWQSARFWAQLTYQTKHETGDSLGPVGASMLQACQEYHSTRGLLGIGQRSLPKPEELLVYTYS